MRGARAGATAAVLAIACAGTLAACTGEPRPEPQLSCDPDTRSAGRPGDADPMLVLGDPGYAPTIVYADGAVVVPLGAEDATAAGGRGSGRVATVRVPLMAPGYGGPEPGGFVGGSLPDCQLEKVIARADALFTADVDFGDPPVTDQASTEVVYDGRSVSVYAFNRSHPDEYGGLSADEQRARDDLAVLWNLVESSARLGDELPIERLHVHLDSPGDIGDGEVVDWPLDTPLSELVTGACATLDDPDDVSAMIERLSRDEPLLASQDWRLTVVAAAPGTECG